MTITHGDDGFRKSSYSNSSNTCVEVKVLPGGGRVVRDRAGKTTSFDAAEWDAFVLGVKDGQFD